MYRLEILLSNIYIPNSLNITTDSIDTTYIKLHDCVTVDIFKFLS